MRYEKPAFVEIKMDAEIGSYQADYDGSHAPVSAPPPVERAGDDPREARDAAAG